MQQVVEVINYIFAWESNCRQLQPSKGFRKAIPLGETLGGF